MQGVQAELARGQEELIYEGIRKLMRRGVLVRRRGGGHLRFFARQLWVCIVSFCCHCLMMTCICLSSAFDTWIGNLGEVLCVCGVCSGIMRGINFEVVKVMGI
jgi:hypothetical protein